MLSPTDRFASTTSELDIYSILGSEQAAIELFNSLGDLEHLKYKISSIHEELKINALVVKRIEKAQTDVSRQLRRIYLLRNRIAHTGHYEKIRPQLVTHLLDYIAVCYMAICASAESAKDGPVCTVGDLLLSYKMGVDVVLDFYQASPEQSNLPTIMTKPVI
ncbi:hypothetical protein C7A17_12180 [Ectopseudomonas mendocina]|uniref:Apea-like HEPN domain-containing protein n=2 Tax=Ectopseudomonas mendocina TaxID=300 RepID=A0A2R3QP18_ECTME|nr:hypothetical protein C7A17_12180 [Pseudomonas mendocina]